MISRSIVEQLYKKAVSESVAFSEGLSGDTPLAWIWEERFVNETVQECIRQLEDELLKDVRPNQTHQISYNEGIRDGITAIKEHFGI